jgi:hypothetical protein
MFTDEHRCEVWNAIRQQDMRAFSKQLTPSVFAEAAKRTGVRLVKSPLCLTNLVWLGVSAAVHAADSFATVLTTTLRLLEDQQEFAPSKIGRAQKNGQRRRPNGRSKHDPRRNDPTVVSEEAFSKARQRMPLAFWVNLIIILGENFAEEHPKQHKFRGFRILAMDGTRLNVPTSQALKDHFGMAKNCGQQRTPQARMVLLQFPFTRMPYHYELAPLAEGEVTLALRLIKHLQAKDLVLLDAGYWSYQLLWAIANRDAYFAIRLHRGINLSKVRNLQRDGQDRLVRWTPRDSRRQWKELGLPTSIDLRVIHYQVPGFRSQAIVTNVLDPKHISRADWTRLTTDCRDARRKLMPGLFHRRWEVETSYYELKVALGLDRHLRSRTPASIQFEVAGYVVYYLLLRWLIVRSAVKHGLDPLRISFVEAVREFEVMRPSLLTATPQWAARVLLPRLLGRIAAHRVPVRPGRHFPRRDKRKRGKRLTKRSSSAKTKGQKTKKPNAAAAKSRAKKKSRAKRTAKAA